MMILPEYLRRGFKYRHMDFEYTLWQMFYIIASPKKVYDRTRYHKQTKNQWARDDPAFVAVLIYCLIVSAIAYTLAFDQWNFIKIFKVVFWTVFIDFLLLGIIVATLGWWIGNKYFRHSDPGLHSVEQSVEWLYAFDIHCNSFFPLFILLYVVQYFLLPVLYSRTFFLSTLLSDLLYAIGFAYYYYITFLGYTALPFLHNTQTFLYPVGIFFILFVIGVLCGFNATVFVMNIYFLP